jgi:heptosyltransferase-2
MIINAKSWTEKNMPKRILAIRLQAMGDMVITLPYLQYLKNHLPPDTIIDFVTREEVDSIPKSLSLFNRIYSISGERSLKKQLLSAALLLPQLLWNSYDVIIDLQNNEVSNLIRKALFPKAWSSFDRFSPLAAGERTRLTIEAAGLGTCNIDSNFIIKINETSLLLNNGWDGHSSLLLLNPAGAFENRNWPIDNYWQFATAWLEQFPDTQFVMMGTNFIEGKSIFLKNKVGSRLINLVGKTTPAQAFAIMQKISLVVSEDSGLMHMAWVSGIPTIVFFGSTRSDWSRPLSKHTFFFDSADLECGSCMQTVCKYGDNHCMTRISPNSIVEKGIALLKNLQTASPSL